MSRFWLVPFVLVLFVVIPFLIWGEALTNLMSLDPETGSFGSGGDPNGESWVWVIGIGLLVADIFIPIPTTAIIAGLGIVYGPLVGAFVAIIGSILAAIIGYAIGRWLGRPIAQRFLGDAMAGGERIFAAYGGWIVAASRWLPVLPEVVSMVAGVSKFHFATFFFAALCGVIPFSIVFALVGHLGAGQPVWTMVASALTPLVLWWLAGRLGLIRKYGLSLKE